MYNSLTQPSRDFVIGQAAMNRLYGEGTGSVIVEEKPHPFQWVRRVWMPSNPAAPYSRKSHLVTTGFCVVVTKIQADLWEAPEPTLWAAFPPAMLSPESALEKVRAVFGLNISETADVFRITRQTAYQWMKLTDMEQVRFHQNRDRIKHIYRAAQFWQNNPPLKGRWLHALLPTGNTVLGLLKDSQINLNALDAAYKALAASTANRRREEGARATHAATALADAFAGLGAGRKVRKK